MTIQRKERFELSHVGPIRMVDHGRECYIRFPIVDCWGRCLDNALVLVPHMDFMVGACQAMQIKVRQGRPEYDMVLLVEEYEDDHIEFEFVQRDFEPAPVNAS